MNKHIIPLLALLITFFSSCKNENEDKSTSILTSKTWKRALVDKNTSSNPPGRILYDPVLNCQKDDTYRFGSNGTLTINQGTDKCNNNVSVNKTIPYTYNKDTKELFIDGVKYTIAEESNQQFKYYQPVPSLTGYDYIVFLLE